MYLAATTGRAFGKSNVQGCHTGKEYDVKNVLLQPSKKLQYDIEDLPYSTREEMAKHI
jgi:hypothetical protein